MAVHQVLKFVAALLPDWLRHEVMSIVIDARDILGFAAVLLSALASMLA